MQDDQEQRYRLAAAECLEQATRSGETETRLKLLVMAQKWLERAGRLSRRGASANEI